MKSFLALSVITILAALVFVGCSQKTATTAPDMSATNSMATNSMPDMGTNMPTSTNK